MCLAQRRYTAVRDCFSTVTFGKVILMFLIPKIVGFVKFLLYPTRGQECFTANCFSVHHSTLP